MISSTFLEIRILEINGFKFPRHRLVHHSMHLRSHTAIPIRFAVNRAEGHQCRHCIFVEVGEAGNTVSLYICLDGYRLFLFRRVSARVRPLLWHDAIHQFSERFFFFRTLCCWFPRYVDCSLSVPHESSFVDSYASDGRGLPRYLLQLGHKDSYDKIPKSGVATPVKKMGNENGRRSVVVVLFLTPESPFLYFASLSTLAEGSELLVLSMIGMKRFGLEPNVEELLPLLYWVKTNDPTFRLNRNCSWGHHVSELTVH